MDSLPEQAKTHPRKTAFPGIASIATGRPVAACWGISPNPFLSICGRIRICTFTQNFIFCINVFFKNVIFVLEELRKQQKSSHPDHRLMAAFHHADIFHLSLGFFFLLVSAHFRFQKNAVVCFQLYAIGLFVNLAYCRGFLQFQFLRICCLAEFFDFCV